LQCLKAATPAPTTSPKPAPKASPKPTPTPSPKPTTTTPKIIDEFKQCGGKGGDCADFGGCNNDAPFAGYQCASGLECKRKEVWYWQVRHQEAD
jgi:hypothetical protein